MTRGMHSAPRWLATCTFEGESSSSRLRCAARVRRPSTRYWEPRERTLKTSMPSIRAASAARGSTFSASSSRRLHSDTRSTARSARRRPRGPPARHQSASESAGTSGTVSPSSSCAAVCNALVGNFASPRSTRQTFSTKRPGSSTPPLTSSGGKRRRGGPADGLCVIGSSPPSAGRPDPSAAGARARRCTMSVMPSAAVRSSKRPMEPWEVL
mmetsp:Transcript_45352/g.145460  ORF Transcript_45352/g.145460 Transcript_45352/m.145460 type:complete len:212 (-) Transcript_45352:3239-3874(-)